MNRRNSYTKRIKEYRRLLQTDPATVTAIDNCLKHRNPDGDIQAEVFLYTMAPALTEFVKWVLCKAKEEKRQRLYFLARDGWLMYHLAQYLAKEDQPKLDIRYLKVSRYSVRSAEYSFVGKECLDTICVGGIDITFEKMMRRALLTEEEAAEVAKQIGYETRGKEVLNYRQIQDLKEQLKRVPVFFEYVQAHAERCYENTVQYLMQEGMLDEVNYALVDSGWIGTLQMSLQRVLAQAKGNNSGTPVRLSGYYFGLYEIPKQAQGQYQAYYFGPKDIAGKIRFSNCLFETICSSPEGMTLRYEKGENGIVPIESEQKNPNAAEMEKFLRLLMAYAGEYSMKSSYSKKLPGKNRKTVHRLLERFMGSPTGSEADAFGGLLFCDDVLELQMQQVAADWDAQEIRNQRFLRKVFIKMNLIEGELHDSAWPEGSIARAGGCTRGKLRQERMYKRVMYIRKALEQ